ncbi:sodium ion-translocating decarboxylase, beta subunit [Streptococcus henryi]|jgi:oxaloacetate decarboxylase beta subunit|uniref:Sodium ion-translocating decarboxylase, beta subunit n=1 Tax=Streptococcus henryi TaxID=439219 RepID=A0A1G6D114_9STRE|nr:sodium ion-translocating decarboxylase subunit beta [Streptococcus henryi]SDB38798.1 sodium ion-translocating decarboxylase, beta subunit [Streptococcus henryi]
MENLQQLVETSGFYNLTYQNVIMIIIACVFLYLGIKKEYEPYLMIPIAFGMLLVNLPLAGLMDAPKDGASGGLLYYLYQGTNLGIYPPLIFLCLGASTDFEPLLANPKTILLGGAAQFGIFIAFFLSVVLGMSPGEAASVGIIGGADGPTALFLTSKLAPHLLPAIALAAYSYMALIPIIQPPIIRLLTTEKERKVVMKVGRKVSPAEKIIFPIVVAIFVSLLVPSAATLIGCLMLGNLIKESKIVPNLTTVLQNALMYGVTIFLGLTVGAKATGELFLSVTTLKIILLGLIAFAAGTAAGVLMGKLMYRLTGGKVNPMIGAAGVSAVPMAARVVQKEGQREDPSNFLLMHAMGPNVAGVIGSAIAAGVLLAFFS